MISKEQQKQESIEQKDFEMNADTSGLTVAGHIGMWHTIDQHEVGGHSFYLMEHDAYGDEAACVIVDERGKLVLDDVYNGFDDDTLRLLDLEVKEVPEMPDPALSVQDMKDYGYAWLAFFQPVRRRLRRLWKRAARFTVSIPITPRACA